MTPLPLHDFHASLGATFAEQGGAEAVRSYAPIAAELHALRERVVWSDLSYRSRLCLTGTDRIRFLHGQVSNQVTELPVGSGCYACLLSAKGKIESDLKIYMLPDELLLEFEPGLTERITRRLEHYIIADDVQVIDAAPHYGLLGFWGPHSQGVLAQLSLQPPSSVAPWGFWQSPHPDWGAIYCMNQPRGGLPGWEWYVPLSALPRAAQSLHQAVIALGGAPCGWDTLECHRIESGVPRFGQDMDESNLPPEAGLDETAVSYTKGCYIGQEVLARVRTYGQVTKKLCGLRLEAVLDSLPPKGAKLLAQGKEVGYVTSAIQSLSLQAPVALGYVRREHGAMGTVLHFRDDQAREHSAVIVPLPFARVP